MNKYILFFSFTLLLLVFRCTPKQISPLINLQANNISNQYGHADTLFTFPLDWLGYWTGQLKIYDSTGQTNQINMGLEISKTDSVGIYNWTIIYDMDSTFQKREYQLKELDSKLGHYLIDEKNGVFLDAFLIQNELTTIFKVMDNTLLISYRLKNQEIIFNVKAFPSKEIRESKTVTEGINEIFKVDSYKLKSSQFAKLYKKYLVE